MDIQIAIKSLAKKRLTTQTIKLPNLDSSTTLADFLTQLVTQQVQAFNDRMSKKNNEPVPLDKDYLSLLVNTGKVSFGDTYNNTQANIDEAINTALQTFTDGMYAVFIDDEQIEQLDTAIAITEHSVISFVRLTFLTGSFW